MAALQRFLNDPPAEGQQGPFPTEAGCVWRRCCVLAARRALALTSPRARPFVHSALPGENEEDEYLFLVSLDAFHDKNSGHRLNGTGCARPGAAASGCAALPRAHRPAAAPRSQDPNVFRHHAEPAQALPRGLRARRLRQRAPALPANASEP